MNDKKGLVVALGLIGVLALIMKAKAEPQPPPECVLNEDCLEGEVCENGVCVPEPQSGEAVFEVQEFVLGKSEVPLYKPVPFSFDLVNAGQESGYVDHAVCAMTGADCYVTVRETIASGHFITVSGTLYPRSIGTYYPTVGLIYSAGEDIHWIFTSIQSITVD